MPPLMLSTDEAVAITLTMAVLRRRRRRARPPPPWPSCAAPCPASVAERVDDVLAAVVPPGASDRLAPGAAPDPRLLATLAAGVVGERVCRVRHRSARHDDPRGQPVRRRGGPRPPLPARLVPPAPRAPHVPRRPDRRRRPARRHLPRARRPRRRRAPSRRRWPPAGTSGRSASCSTPRWPTSRRRSRATSASPRPSTPPRTRLRLTTRNLDATVLRLSDHPFAMTRRGAGRAARGVRPPGGLDGRVGPPERPRRSKLRWASTIDRIQPPQPRPPSRSRWSDEQTLGWSRSSVVVSTSPASEDATAAPEVRAAVQVERPWP